MGKRASIKRASVIATDRPIAENEEAEVTASVVSVTPLKDAANAKGMHLPSVMPALVTPDTTQAVSVKTIKRRESRSRSQVDIAGDTLVLAAQEAVVAGAEGRAEIQGCSSKRNGIKAVVQAIPAVAEAPCVGSTGIDGSVVEATLTSVINTAVADTSSVEISTEQKRVRSKRKRKQVDLDGVVPHALYAHSNHFVGYHCSGANGIYNALLNANAVGARAFAFFTRSARKWENSEIPTEDAELFRQIMHKLKYKPEHIMPHGSYLTNLGSSDPTLREKSLRAVCDEATRLGLLGLHLYNFHPGSAGAGADATTRMDACTRVAEAINLMHEAVPGVVMVIETMAGQGSTIGSSFDEIAAMIARVRDKERVGVCIDTAHIHGAGYDIRDAAGYQRMMEEFNRIVGLQYLRGMHLNDSAVELNSRVDRHAHIGAGKIGITAFHSVMNDARTAHIPLILETPAPEDHAASLQKYAREIGLLYALEDASLSDCESLLRHPAYAPPPPEPKKPKAAKRSRKAAGLEGEEGTEEDDNAAEENDEATEPTGTADSTEASQSLPAVSAAKGSARKRQRNMARQESVEAEED